jgi:hypothetical protein
MIFFEHSSKFKIGQEIAHYKASFLHHLDENAQVEINAALNEAMQIVRSPSSLHILSHQ